MKLKRTTMVLHKQLTLYNRGEPICLAKRECDAIVRFHGEIP